MLVLAALTRITQHFCNLSDITQIKLKTRNLLQQHTPSLTLLLLASRPGICPQYGHLQMQTKEHHSLFMHLRWSYLFIMHSQSQ